MNRRNFLQSAMAAAAALAVDPERLLWEPEKKTIFIPKPIVEDPFEDPYAFINAWEHGRVRSLKVPLMRNRADQSYVSLPPGLMGGDTVEVTVFNPGDKSVWVYPDARVPKDRILAVVQPNTVIQFKNFGLPFVLNGDL